MSVLLGSYLVGTVSLETTKDGMLMRQTYSLQCLEAADPQLFFGGADVLLKSLIEMTAYVRI